MFKNVNVCLVLGFCRVDVRNANQKEDVFFPDLSYPLLYSGNNTGARTDLHQPDLFSLASKPYFWSMLRCTLKTTIKEMAYILS